MSLRTKTRTAARLCMTLGLALLLACGGIPALALAEAIEEVGNASEEIASVEVAEGEDTTISEDLVAQDADELAGVEAESDALGNQTELLVEEDVEEATVTQEDDPDGSSEESSPVVETQSAFVSNPRRSGQRVTWDCVWFGTYPQTEVTSADPVYSSMQSATWDASGNTSMNGTRYRRISKANATNTDNWPRGSTQYRYFRYDPIKWRVLHVDGSKALVLSDVALDDQLFDPLSELDDDGVTWETSTMRSWLNGYGADSNKEGVDYSGQGFVSAAFPNSGERAAIVRNGTDAVLLLDAIDVQGTDGYSYGFAKEQSASDMARQCLPSDFASAMGAGASLDASNDKNCWWWLRSQGQTSYDAANVDSDGIVNGDGDDADCDDGAVRPALYVDLGSTSVTPAGTVSSDGNVDEVLPYAGVWGTYAWGFANQSISKSDNASYYPTREEVYDLYGYCIGDTIYNDLDDNLDGGGSCYGMVVASQAVTVFGEPMLSQLGKNGNVASVLHDVTDLDWNITGTWPLKDKSVGKFIALAHVLQADYSITFEHLLINSTGPFNYANLESFVRAIRNGEPITCDMSVFRWSTLEHHGHSVWPLRVLRDNNNSTEIEVYDSNVPDNSVTLTLTKDARGVYDGWKIPSHNGKDGYWSSRGFVDAQGNALDVPGSDEDGQPITYQINGGVLRWSHGIDRLMRYLKNGEKLSSGNAVLVRCPFGQGYAIDGDEYAALPSLGLANDPHGVAYVQWSGDSSDENGASNGVLFWANPFQKIAFKNVDKANSVTVANERRGVSVNTADDSDVVVALKNGSPVKASINSDVGSSVSVRFFESEKSDMTLLGDTKGKASVSFDSGSLTVSGMSSVSISGTNGNLSQTGLDPNSAYSIARDARGGFGVTKLDVSCAAVSNVATAVYAGRAITPTPKVTLGGKTLKAGTDYKLSYKNNVNAGTATVILTGKGNYTGTKSTTFTIAKATNGLKVKKSTKKVKVAKARKKKQTVKPLKVTGANGIVRYKKVAKGSSKCLTINKKTGKVTIKKGTKKGTYKIKVKVSAAGDNNHKAAGKTVTCKVVVK